MTLTEVGGRHAGGPQGQELHADSDGGGLRQGGRRAAGGGRRAAGGGRRAARGCCFGVALFGGFVGFKGANVLKGKLTICGVYGGGGFGGPNKQTQLQCLFSCFWEGWAPGLLGSYPTEEGNCCSPWKSTGGLGFLRSAGGFSNSS